MGSRAQDAFKRDASKQQMNVTLNRTPQFVSDFGSSSQTRGRILVAVDFGTTFSAAAWMWVGAVGYVFNTVVVLWTRPLQRFSIDILGQASTTKPLKKGSTDRPLTHLIVEWPHEAEEMSKVPTVLQKDDDDHMKWGFECNKDEPRYQWFKLEQDPKYKAEQLKRAYPPLTIKPENAKQAKNLITQYLQLLRGHVETSIRESLDNGGKKASTLLKGVPWEYIITVPAMWPESAQSITEQCARDAGMAVHRPVKIIAEPEAAGIYALDQMCREPGLDVGDTFLICDAGGGTVDLISYTVTQVEPSPVLEEAAAGTGGLCGSSFLDREFLKWLDNHVSNCRQWNQDHTDAAMERWEEEVKRNFTTATDRKYLIRCMGVDDDASLNIKNKRLQISTSRMKKIFAPVINQILELVDDQIQRVKANNPNRQVNTILLAGGFGKNEYLKESIQAAVGKHVRVKRMPDCTTAIVKGALIRGLEEKRSSTTGTPTITVGSRMARKHYGTEALQKYSQGWHDPKRPRHPGGVDGGERIYVMRWFVNKNTRVKEFEPMKFDFYYDQRVEHAKWNGHLDTIDLPIYVCEKDTAPEYPDSKLNKSLVTVKADLNRIPKDKLEKQKGEDGEWYYKVEFQIIMMRSLANVTFKLVHDDKEYGTVDADWDTT